MTNRVWKIDLGYDRPPMLKNEVTGMNRFKVGRLKKSVREVAGWRARSAGIPRVERCKVTLVWYVTTKHRRDKDGPMLTLSAAIDGLVDAGVLFDDNRHVVIESKCDIQDAPEKGVVLVIEEVEV